MNAGKRYQIDRTRIIFEQFEDETVLVNTETGYYYSLSNTGSEVLRLLDEGCSADDLPIILFGSSSSEDTHQRWDIVRKFVEKLVDESIIAARSSDSSNHIGKDPGPARYGEGIEYVPPVLERFDDVRDLLLIDPIHQVDQEYGWPKEMGNGNSSRPRN